MINWLLLIASLLILPPLVLGTIRRCKARLQNRIGAPIFQMYYDVIKLCRKGETLSQTLSWIFRSSALMNFSFLVLLATILPWANFKPQFNGVDLFFVVYIFAAARFFTLLAALDSGSAFAAFGASREATLALLVEPAYILGLSALAVANKSSDLSACFAFNLQPSAATSAIWIFSGLAILLAGIVELSRMPIDDPNTHLELTMVHEAMILEASGRNLALIEFAHALKMTITFGLVSQCFMHAIPQIYAFNSMTLAGLGILGIFVIAVVLGLAEVLTVKLRWSKNPDFIAYSLTMSLLACFIAIGKDLL